MKYRLALLLGLMILGPLNACAKRDHAERPQAKVKPKMTTTYQVGNLQSGTFTPLGTLSFDEDNNPKLDLTSQGSAAEDLRSAVAGIAEQDKIRIKRSQESEHEVRYVGVEIDKTSDEYPQAVVDYLSSRHGFFATPLGESE